MSPKSKVVDALECLESTIISGVYGCLSVDIYDDGYCSKCETVLWEDAPSGGVVDRVQSGRQAGHSDAISPDVMAAIATDDRKRDGDSVISS